MKPTRFRIGKSYETIVNGILMQSGFDIYLPIVDDKGIDGVIRVDKKSVKHYDFQVKGGKTFARIRANTDWIYGDMILFLYSLEDNKLLWFQYKDLNRYFKDKPGDWGNLFINSNLKNRLLKSKFSNLNNLKKRIGMI